MLLICDVIEKFGCEMTFQSSVSFYCPFQDCTQHGGEYAVVIEEGRVTIYAEFIKFIIQDMLRSASSVFGAFRCTMSAGGSFVFVPVMGHD